MIIIMSDSEKTSDIKESFYQNRQFSIFVCENDHKLCVRINETQMFTAKNHAPKHIRQHCILAWFLLEGI